MRPLRSLPPLLAVTLALVTAPASAAVTTAPAATTQPHAITTQPSLTGRLIERNSVRILQLWGTPDQRGYAHGYLMAPAIMDILTAAIHDTALIKAPIAYEQITRPMVNAWVSLPDHYQRELAGMHRGMADRLGSRGLWIPDFNRSLDTDDLIVMNCFSDWLTMMACSSFSAWGRSTPDGQTITARNLDYFRLDAFFRQFLVIACLDPAADRHPWVSITWPGLIGCYTGMNDQGVTISINDVIPLHASLPQNLMPRTLALREAIELADADTAINDVQTVLRRCTPVGGCNVHVSAPVIGNAPPAAIFEYDGNSQIDHGVTRRSPDANLPDAVIATNHYRLRRPPSPCQRFDDITAAIRNYQMEPARLDKAAAADIMNTAAVCSPRIITMYTVYFIPHQKRIGLAFATPDSPAPRNPTTWFDLSELLAPQTRALK